MSIYYNSVGEGWFKKKDEVVSEENSELLKAGDKYLKDIQKKVLNKIDENELIIIANKIKEIKKINKLKNKDEVQDLYELMDRLIMLIDNELSGLNRFENDVISIAQMSDIISWIEE